MSSSGPEITLEGAPQDWQKERLEDFLTELMLLTRKYRILLRDEHETTELVDLANGRLIGLGIAHFTAPEDECKILSYLAADSILDGVWPVDTPEGPVEQYLVASVFPRRA